MLAIVNALEMNGSDMELHDVENESDPETENFVVTGYHHDCLNETLLIGARRDGQANVSPPYIERPAKTGSVIESNDVNAVRHAQLRPFIH